MKFRQYYTAVAYVDGDGIPGVDSYSSMCRGRRRKKAEAIIR
jgi:hypothetical protein